MKEVVKPIKDSWVLQTVQHELKDKPFTGLRDYTIFQVGKATLLRVSDVLSLKKSDVYERNGRVKKNAYTIDKKTKKRNVLYLRPVERELEDYYDWLEEMQQKFYGPKHDGEAVFESKFRSRNSKFNGRVFSSEWLFPSFNHAERHIDGKAYYKIMSGIGQKLHIDYLGTHTMRKTGAYRVYQQTNNIALVMKLLNHSSQSQTLRYLGLDQEEREHLLDTVDFG
ncbi:site-specific recombinase, phage integrase family [Lactobacillus hamsteri DSM 5661 = JCM 6256]|uniref:Site-specific recombinase, phage integrase family n=1 Tax=Lactobacillus hamsteri DSM 5661 = JCM 6256 TaxID=1423754 RepID=A0A0R1Y6T5_9LACO|nr:tyrosine-type recombinase/integrase [Lactobacillus hamsteri]KRM37477.1 site-specific recombinase, phage integrase family [Lactobacillus hamsteri DSM 5661 = JCM 6256]